LNIALLSSISATASEKYISYRNIQQSINLDKKNPFIVSSDLMKKENKRNA
jgi:hypothetical protein